MDNYKKLSQELLIKDGIDPANVSDTERAMFKAMLDKEMKHLNRLSWLSVSLIGIFVIALLGLCLSERVLEALHIPFVIAWAVVIIGIYVILILLWPNHFRKIKASGKKVQRLHFIVHGKYRGFPLVGKKDGKRYIDWLSIILLVIALWMIISLGSAGVYYLLCRRWVFSMASGSAFHIFFMTIMSLAFVMPLLYRGLKAPLEELTEIKAENYTCSRRRFSIITAAVIIIGIMIFVDYLGAPINIANITWAEVIQSFEEQLQTNDYIHLIITNRKLTFGELDIGDIVRKEEIWAQRPFNMRIEENYQVNYLPDHINLVPTTTIYNEKGEYHINHKNNCWGFRDANLIDTWKKITFRELRNEMINDYLNDKYYANFNIDEGTYKTQYGTIIQHTELDGEKITIYEFDENKGKINKCWIRDKNGRLMRMEKYIEGHEKPVEIYEVLSYEAPLNEHFFEANIPRSYHNGQLLGYEDQPQLLNPEVVTVVIDEKSAKFYSLDIKPGQSREEAIAEAIATTETVLEVEVEQPSLLKVIAKQPEESKRQKPESMYKTGSNVVGDHWYGILYGNEDDSESQYIDIMTDTEEYKGQGQIIFETLTYKTDYNFCKIAFDADGDGEMDIWCQIPSEQVVSTWREALINEQ